MFDWFCRRFYAPLHHSMEMNFHSQNNALHSGSFFFFVAFNKMKNRKAPHFTTGPNPVHSYIFGKVQMFYACFRWSCRCDSFFSSFEILLCNQSTFGIITFNGILSRISVTHIAKLICDKKWRKANEWCTLICVIAVEFLLLHWRIWDGNGINSSVCKPQ